MLPVIKLWETSFSLSPRGGERVGVRGAEDVIIIKKSGTQVLVLAESNPWPRKNFDFPNAWFIMIKISLKEVIPGASAPTHHSQKVLNPGCSGGLGKARIPKAPAEGGEDRLGLVLQALNFC